MRRWPSPIRWRVAARPPDQFAEPTVGTPGSGSPAVSTTTNGMLRVVSWLRWSSSRSASTRITPSGRRVSRSSNHSRRGRCSPPSSDSTTAARSFAAACSTPRMISVAHAECISWNTRSMSAGRDDSRARLRRYRRCSITLSTRARVWAATSGLPLRTFETVGIETPASAAMEAMDAGGGVSPSDGSAPVPSGVLMLTPCPASIPAPRRRPKVSEQEPKR